jgi:hypothetical protein
MDMTTFQQFCSEQFPFIAHLSGLRDGRSQPQIKPDTIFKALLYGGVLGLGSLLGVDQFVRTPGGKALFKRVGPVVSDSTISRWLATMDQAQLHGLLQRLYAKARTMGPSRLPLGLQRLRVAMMDGTSFGHMYACCFAQIGPMCLLADLKRMKNQGKELPTAKMLLKRLVTRFGEDLVDLLLLDGLYVAKDFIKYSLSVGIDVLIKTQEEDLLILQDAMGLLMHPDATRFGVAIDEGMDQDRLRTYEIRALDGFFLKGVDTPFKVAYVQEQEIKTGIKHVFWVLTTRQDLGPDQMRQLAHQRWQVENNGFKALNHLVHTKHQYAHKKKAQEAMTLILMMAANLLQLFDLRITDQQIINLLGKVKRTVKLMQQLIRQTLLCPLPDT